PADVQRPGAGAAMPPSHATPLAREPFDGGGGGQASLLQVLAAAAGADAEGVFPDGYYDPLLNALLSVSATGGGAGVNFAPIPFVSFAQNEGTTGGAIVPIWATNKDGEIEALATP